MTQTVDSSTSANSVIEADGIDTAVIDSGTGPAVLLLHGAAPGASSRGTWPALIAQLNTTHRVIAPDFAGFGESAKPLGAEYGVRLWAKQIRSLVDTLELPTVSIVGNALGGRVALELATTHPELVDRLVLMCTRVMPSRSPAQALLRSYTPDRAKMRTLLQECFASDTTVVSDELVDQRYRNSAQPGAHEAIQQFFADTPDDTEKLERALATVAIPTLVLHGRHDRVVPVANSIRIAELVAHAELHVFADTGHWFAVDRPAQFNAIVSDFLSESR